HANYSGGLVRQGHSAVDLARNAFRYCACQRGGEDVGHCFSPGFGQIFGHDRYSPFLKENISPIYPSLMENTAYTRPSVKDIPVMGCQYPSISTVFTRHSTHPAILLRASDQISAHCSRLVRLRLLAGTKRVVDLKPESCADLRVGKCANAATLGFDYLPANGQA